MRQQHARIRVADRDNAGHMKTKIVRENATRRVAGLTQRLAAIALPCIAGIFLQMSALAQSASAPIVNLIPDAPVMVADNGGASIAPSPPCDPYKNYSCLDDYLG